MKNIITLLFFLLLFFLMLIMPQEVFHGATNGLILWLWTIVPTLFPFLILTNLMLRTNVAYQISSFLYPFLSKIFCVSKNACFATLCGFLCGYPMGAKVTCELVKTNRITKKEGAYLLSFCNNVSPMFIINFVVLSCMKQQNLLFPFLIILTISPIVSSFIFRLYYRPELIFVSNDKTSINFHFNMLDNALNDAMLSITKIGGNIIMFSVLLEIAKHYFPIILLCNLEITSGLNLYVNQFGNGLHSYIPILFMSSFGGLCSVAQTNIFIKEVNIPILPYIIEKLITAMVTSLIAFIWLLA